MRTSQRGVDLIKRFEGLSLQAVRLAGEAYYTIGYGHYGADVAAGQTVTQAEAEALLRSDLQKFEGWVTQYVSFALNQNQFDALVSFTYNCGPGSLQQLVTGRTPEQVAEHIMAYTGSSSAAYTQGLRNRRTQERALFLEPMAESEEKPMGKYYTDTAGHWAEQYIDRMRELGLMNGRTADRFDPDTNVTRAELATVMARLMEKLIG